MCNPCCCGGWQGLALAWQLCQLPTVIMLQRRSLSRAPQQGVGPCILYPCDSLHACCDCPSQRDQWHGLWWRLVCVARTLVLVCCGWLLVHPGRLSTSKVSSSLITFAPCWASAGAAKACIVPYCGRELMWPAWALAHSTTEPTAVRRSSICIRMVGKCTGTRDVAVRALLRLPPLSTLH